MISREYPSATLNEANEDESGYIDSQVYAIPTYELVTGLQAYVSRLMAPFVASVMLGGSGKSNFHVAGRPRSGTAVRLAGSS
jgi:hypothetical protein